MAARQTSAVCSRNDKKQTFWTFVNLIWEDFQNNLLCNSFPNISDYTSLLFTFKLFAIFLFDEYTRIMVIICVFGSQVIEMKFDKFDLESDNYCRFDYVAFYNGGEKDDSRRIGKYCGDSGPQSVTSIFLTSLNCLECFFSS